MVAEHDYAGCPADPCRLCAAFSDGWTFGRQKSFEEVASLPEAGHTSDCACRPCHAYKTALVGFRRVRA